MAISAPDKQRGRTGPAGAARALTDDVPGANGSEAQPTSHPRTERGVTVADIMSVDLLQCSPETTVRDCARMMARDRKSSIIIVDADGAVAGIWTERDALKHDLTRAETRQAPIRTVMSAPVRTIEPDRDISEVTSRLRSDRLRHYVVANERNEPLGVVTQSDIVLNHGVESFMRLHTVESIVSGAPIWAQADDRLSSAVERMRHANADCLVAEHPNGDLGIVTERDVVRYIASYDQDAPVWDMATAPMTTILSTDSLFYARNLMVSHQFRHLGVIDGEGTLIGVIGFRDILSTIEQSYIEELEIALAERDSALRASEERYRMLVELSPDAILVVQDDRIAFANPAAQRLLGADRAGEIADTSFWDFLSPWPNLDEVERRERVTNAAQTEDHRYLEEAVQRLNGETLDVELLATEITYNDQRAFQIVLRDISERKDLERELNILARTDSLTGAANRMHLEPHLEQAAREADRYGYRFSLIMFDIDHFKRVNDTFGHDAGDRILAEITATVRGQLRESDILCRWGGEEFMVLAASTDESEAQRLAERIQTAVRENDFGTARPLTVTLAVAGYRPNEGLKHFTYRLDSALYAGKSAGRDRVRLA